MHNICSRTIQGEDDGQELVDLSDYVSVRDSDKPVGVYAVYDEARSLQYVGYSRNVVAALKVPHQCLNP